MHIQSKKVRAVTQLALSVLLVSLAVPAVAKTHKDVFKMPCSTLWAGVKDTLRNSGKYGIIGIDNTEMTASYTMGGFLSGKRLNSVVLNSQGDGCEMQTQSNFSGLANNDAADFKKRVVESLARLKDKLPAPVAKPKDGEKSTPAPSR